MHVREIKAFASKANLDRQFSGRNAKVVVILPKDGTDHYVSLRGTTTNKDDAFVYDYDRDRVAEQCAQVVEMMGVVPRVVEV